MGTLLALGLGLAQTANAADCLALSVQLTAYQQDRDEEKVSASLILSTVKKVKITTQDLLNLLAQYHGLTFPSGTQICLDATDETKIATKLATSCSHPAPPCSSWAAVTRSTSQTSTSLQAM